MDVKREHTKYAAKFNKLIDRFYSTYPARIKALREGRDPHNRNFDEKLTQKDISTIADILPQNYGKIEQGLKNGGNNITLAQAIKMSVIYGCSLQYIVYGEEENELDKNTIRDLQLALESERRLAQNYQETIALLQARLAGQTGK